MRAAHGRTARARQRSLTFAALFFFAGSWGVQTDPAAQPSSQPAPTSGRPDLTGVWVLNQKLSEDPWEKLEQARDRDWLSHGLSGGWGGRQPTAEVTGVRGGGPGKRNRDIEEVRPLWNAPRRLRLSHRDPLLEIQIDDRRTRRVYTDNRGVSVSASGASQDEVSTAGWEKDVLVVETTTDAGTQVVEHYRLSEDGQRLLVTKELLTLQDSEPVTVETVYDRRPGGSDAE